MKKPKKVYLPPVSLGLTVNENLPFPIVHYPGHYGTFIAFSADNNSSPYLCLCSRSAVENFLILRKNCEFLGRLDSVKSAHLGFNEFPSQLSTSLRRLINKKCNLDTIFKPTLCHRCNMKTPSVRWCHEIYGVSFVQYYGWYINQTYFRLGISPGPLLYEFIPDNCPEELIKDIEEINQVVEKFQKFERLYLARIENTSIELSLSNDEDPPVDIRFVNQIEYKRLSREVSKIRRKFTTKIENIARTEFGIKKVGEGWISETLLYKIISNLYPNNQIIRHFRPDWLNRLELDIYLPELKLAFEYQGQQHFYSVKAWGGEKALLDVQARDKTKSYLCKLNGINLITIDYTEPLSEEYLKQVICTQMKKA